MPCVPLDCYAKCRQADKDKLKKCRELNRQHIAAMKINGCPGTKCTIKSFAKACRRSKFGYSASGTSTSTGNQNSSKPPKPPSNPPPGCWPGNNNCGNGYNQDGSPKDPTTENPSPECWAGNNNCGYGYNPDGSPKEEKPLVSGDSGAPLERPPTTNPVDPPVEECWAGNNNCGFGYNPDGTSANPADYYSGHSEVMEEPGGASGGGSVDLNDGGADTTVECNGNTYTLPLEDIKYGDTVSMPIDDGTIRDYTVEEYCAFKEPILDGIPCVYSSAANFVLFGVLELSAITVAFGLPPIASFDQTICDYDKEKILDDVLSQLDSIRGSDLDFFEGDVNSVIDGVNYAGKSLQGNWADVVVACVQFGRGNFGESVLAILDAIPGYGNFLGDALDYMGFSGMVSDALNSINEDDKQSIIELVIDSMAVAAAIPNPGTPVIVPLVALAQSAIMFGRKQWDEAVFNILMLGLGKIVGVAAKFIGKITAAKPYLGPLTSTGTGPTPPPEGIMKIIDQILKVIKRIVAVFEVPLKKLAQRQGLMDAAGNLTASGEAALEGANVALKVFTGGYDFADGATVT